MTRFRCRSPVQCHYPLVRSEWSVVQIGSPRSLVHFKEQTASAAECVVNCVNENERPLDRRTVQFGAATCFEGFVKCYLRILQQLPCCLSKVGEL